MGKGGARCARGPAGRVVAVCESGGSTPSRSKWRRCKHLPAALSKSASVEGKEEEKDEELLDVGPRDVRRSTGLGLTQRAILAVAPGRLQRWSSGWIPAAVLAGDGASHAGPLTRYRYGGLRL